MDLLEEWLKRNGEKATLEVLMEAMSEANLQSTVDELKNKYPVTIEAPGGLKATETGNYSVTLQWNPVKSNQLFGYLLERSLAFSPVWSSAHESLPALPRQPTELEVGDLTPYTAYHFRVKSAINEKGHLHFGDGSEPAYVLTKKQYQPHPPGYVRVTGVKRESVSLTWTKPLPADDVSLESYEYVVEMCDYTENMILNTWAECCTTTQRECTIKVQHRGNYRFRVSANNKDNAVRSLPEEMDTQLGLSEDYPVYCKAISHKTTCSQLDYLDPAMPTSPIAGPVESKILGEDCEREEHTGKKKDQGEGKDPEKTADLDKGTDPGKGTDPDKTTDPDEQADPDKGTDPESLGGKSEEARMKKHDQRNLSEEKERLLMERFGLKYMKIPDSKKHGVPLALLIDCLIGEACAKCDMGEHEAALSRFEDALGIIYHYPNTTGFAESIYWLRAKCCFDMAKELADDIIEEEEKGRAKKKKIVFGQATTEPKGKKRKNAKQIHATGSGERDVTNVAEPEKHVENLDVSNDSSDSCSSDSEQQGYKEEEDLNEKEWTTVGKHRPIPTHNRFKTSPAAGSARTQIAVTSTGRKMFAARSKAKAKAAAASHKHTIEGPPLKPPQQQKSIKRVQSYKSPIHATTRPKRHIKPSKNADASTEVQPTNITIQDFIKKKTPICREANGAEGPPAKGMIFSRYHEDIKAGTTTVREAYCDYCQLQCNSQQQLRNHYQGKKHKAKLLSDDSDQMWQQRRPPPGVPAGQYKMCPSNRFGRCIHGLCCTYAHTEEELNEWQQRYEIRKQRLKAAQTSGRYSHTFAETLVEEYDKAKDKTKVAQLQVKRVAFMEGSCNQFKIKAVNSTSGQPIGLLSEDEQEWISHGAQQSISTDFTVQITFRSNQYGSFNQAVVFDFGQRPYLFCPFHVDVAMETDLESLKELRSKFTLLGTSWENQGKVVHYIGEANMDEDVDEELRVKYQLPQGPEKLVNLKISKEDTLNKFNYRKRQHELLFIEEAEQTKHVRRLTLQTVGIVTNMLEKIFTDSTNVDFAHGGERFIQIFLNEALSEDTPQGYLLTRSLSPKAQVIIHREYLDQDAYEVWVEWTTKDSIWLRIPSSLCQHFGLEQDTKVNMEVQFMLDRSPMLFRHCAVDTIKDLTLLFPYDPNVSKRFWKNLRKQILSPPRTLNDKQREAFAKITAPTEHLIPPLLLIGPFGTGKTYTIAAAASAAARQDGSRILICTHTNDAADLYIRNYLKTGDVPGSHTLRIYYKKRKKATVHDDVLKHCIMNEDGAFRYPTREEVAAAKIVITTLSLSLVLEREVGLEPGFFTHIMVDEAAQALECEAITPLSLATAKTRVVLTGDHMQLSPKVFSSLAKEKGFHQSLLERLFYHYQQMVPDDDLHPCITLLHENYRCHNDILKFPSKVWEVADRVKAIWDTWPEAEWGEKNPKSMAQIGVVTPYQDQVNRIRLALRRKGLAGVTVETVTNVQGKEYRALFLSTVRTRATCFGEQLNPPQKAQEDESYDFGFLSDPKLLNTAITRAKSFVGVVGDPVSLCSVGSCSKIWFEYIEHCSKHRSLHGASVEEIKHYLDMIEMEASSLPLASVFRPEAPIFVPQKEGIHQTSSEVQGLHKSQQKETSEEQHKKPMKDYKSTLSTRNPPGRTSTVLPYSADEVNDSQRHSHKTPKVPEDSLPHQPKDADLISSALQRQISKAESNAEDDLNNSSSSESDEMIDNHAQGLSPATTKQKEATRGSTDNVFTDEKDDIVKELQKQVTRVEDPNYAQKKEYEEDYPKPHEASGADESRTRPSTHGSSDSNSGHGEHNAAQKGRVKHKALFSLGTSIASSSKRTILSTEGYKARYTYAEFDEESERLRGRAHFYQKHFDENTLYELLEKQPNKYVKCRIQMSKALSGQGHGVMEDPVLEDIHLGNQKRLNRAFEEDEVVVELDIVEDTTGGLQTENGKARREGRVVGILRPAVAHQDLQFVCFVDDHDPNVLIPVQKGAPKFQNVVPQEKKDPTNCIQLYSITEDGKLKSEQRVPHHRVAKRRGLFVTRFLKWEPHFVYPLGVATKMIEPGDSEEHAVNALMADHMIQETFPKQVLDHVDQMIPKGLTATDSYPNRYDLTDHVAVTIDPQEARDLDDALSVRQLKNGKYEVSIHIADVSNFIKKGDPVDREALARGTSYYPHTAAKAMVPMLPPQLCTNLLSLIPKGEKYVITVCVEIDEKSGNISKRRFFPSKIRPKVKLTYHQAQSILNGEKVTEGIDRDVVLSIQHLGRISKMLRTERLRELAFLRNDADEDMACSDAHYLVEEFMIMANSFVSEYVMEHFPYCTFLRRQLPPKDHRMIEWKETHGDTAEESLLLSREMDRYNALGRITDIEGSDDQHLKVIIIREIIWTAISRAAENGDIQKLQMLVLFDDNHPQLAVAKGHYRRIQSRAVYVSSGQYQDRPDMYGHFSLNMPAYTHFTSPIRRYADIVVHRLLVAAMTGSTCPYEQDEMEELCAHLTQKAWNSKAFDKEVSLIKMAFEIQKRPIVQQAFIETIDRRRIHLNFPDYPEIPASNRTISMAHLQPDQQPTWIEGTVTFVWRPRIYDLSRFNPESYSSTRSLLPDDDAVKTCTYTKRISSSTWKAMVEAIREIDIGSLKQVVDHANQVEVHNDSEQKRLLEISGGETSTAKGNLQWQRILARTHDFEEEYEDELIIEDEGYTTGDSDQRGGERSAASELLRCNKTIEVAYSPYDVIQVQLTTEMYRGLLTPTIQLLKLTPAVDICLEHRRDPVGVFATRTGEMAYKEMYDSLEQYIHLWHPVLEMEAANSINDLKKDVTIMGIKIQWKKNLGEIHGTFQIPGQFARACCFLIRSGDQLCVRYANLHSTSDVISTRESDDTFNKDSFESAYSADKEGPTWVAHCIVDEVTPHPVRLKEPVDKYDITVRLHHHSADIPRCLLEPAFGARRSCTVEHIPVPVPVRRMLSAVEGLVEKSKKCAILEEICINRHPESLQMTDQDLESKSKDDDLGVLHQVLVHPNVYQKEAVKRALCCPFYVIQGPPGTGKTVTGAHLAYKMAKRNLKYQNGNVVMYCGPSNKSVDVVAELLNEMESGLKILRVYSKMIEEADYPIPNYPRVSSLKKTSNEKLRNITLHHVIRQPGTPYGQQLRAMEETFRRKQLAREPISDDEVDSYLDLIEKASSKRMKGVEIILCTCNMAGDPKITSAPVKQCIIDEAGMCMEPESLIPISSFPLEQVVLIGDHQQLQPIVSQPDARDLGLGVSLFERHAKKAFMLQIQYRMHEKICEFPSHKFYDDKLETAGSVKWRPPDMALDNFWPSKDSPVVFCHVEGVEEALPVASAEGGVMSQSNQQEVDKVVQVVSELVVQVRTAQITVLSPYRAQVHQIKECLKEKKLDYVSVRTIVDSQGSEWDYVVLSTVRSLPQAEIPAQPSRRWMTDQLGFLTDDHQINVGLTRAKRGFIIVGNKNLLQTHSTWSHLVKFYEGRDYLVDATEFP
ncbi:HELZ2 [Branchiostoma lanceolatum]|uniref:HELZ2 protein n=1 Tax=Branchiostoma lanceolatum TaxID=7740 RepID=A0A8J9YZ39_BRALA|nr:HELZ2 [Branchiostoma lanceolatum]